jgi:uncharacterized DUF497 family protein
MSIEAGMDVEFEWSEQKAESNAQKHGVTFQEAATIFADPFLITFDDEAHSAIEDRFMSIGTSDQERILVVIHTDRADAIRIISARVATRREQRVYE